MAGLIDSGAAVAYIAEDVPAIQQPPLVSIADASSGSGTAAVAKNIASGDVNWRTASANPNAAILDRIAALGGCNAHAVNASFPPLLSAGTGLHVDVAAGEVLIGGPVQIAAQSVVVPDDTATVWIWAKQDRTVIPVATSTTPPAGECCLLGSVTTASGFVTAVDASGVVYLMGGQLVRQTADAGAPADAPPSTVLLWTKTASGLHQWQGDAHNLIVPTVDGALQLPSGTSDPTGTLPGTGVYAWYRTDLDQIRVVVNGGDARIFREGYDIAFSIEAAPTASQVLLRFVAPRAVTLPAALTGSIGKAGTAATAQTDLDVKLNGSSVGTVRFAADGTTASFIAAAEVDLAAGDVLTVVAPASPDATLAKITVTLKGI